eukprot:3151109-Prymnesium_polylepis.1
MAISCSRGSGARPRVWIGAEPLCKRPEYTCGAQGWRCCRFFRRSAPRRKTAALTRISEGHVGGDLSATEHDQRYIWV